MAQRGCLELLNPEEKWQGARVSMQFLYSLALHACLFSGLVFAICQPVVRNLQQDSSVSVELVAPGQIVTADHALLAVPATAKSLPLEKSDLTNAKPTNREGLPQNADDLDDESAAQATKAPFHAVGFGPAAASAVKAQGPHTRVAKAAQSQGHGARESSAVRVKAPILGLRSSAKTKPSLLHSEEYQQGELATRKEAISSKTALAFLLPQETFAELDMKACHAFVQGEQIEESDLAKARELWREAISIMDKAVPILKRASGAESSSMAEAFRNLGRCYDKLKEYDRSSEYFLKSAEMFERTDGPASLKRGISLVYLADAQIAQKQYTDAENSLLLSLPIYKSAYGAENQYVAWTYRRLSRICYLTNRQAEGIEWQAKADSILNKKN